MSLENPEPIAHVARPALTELPPVLDTAAASHDVTRAATPEELQAVEALFAQRGRERESAAVAGLFGAWGAGMLAHDLLRDYLTDNGGPVEDEKNKKKRPGDEPTA